MSHIGPQMPPHLAKRKRTPEDGDDDGHAHKEAGRRVRRASPPLTAKPTNDDEIALDDESDDNDSPNVSPVLPAAPSVSVTARPRMGLSMGPTMPPSPAPKTAPKPVSDSASDSDSDSDYGPALPGAHDHSEATAAYVEEQDAQEDDDARLYGVARPPAGPAGPDASVQRDDWMLAPPIDDVGARAADPTKIRARKFATGRAANAVEARAAGGGAAASAIGSLWTETIEQKSRRLADTVLGRAPDPTRAGPRPEAQTTRSGGSVSTPSRKADAREVQIMAYTEATRGRSLYETHQESIKGGKRTGDEDRDKHGEKRDREREKGDDRHRHRESDRHSDRHSDKHRDRESSRRDRESDRRDRQPDGRDRESHRHRDRDSDKHRHRDSDKHRHRHDDRHHRHRDGSSSTSKRKQEELDDPSARAFDREKDMSLGVQINHKQRRDLLNRASDFGGRFQKGSYL